MLPPHALIRVANISGQEQRLAAQLGHLASGRLGCRLILPVVDADPRAVPREAPSDRPANAARAAGHQYHR